MNGDEQDAPGREHPVFVVAVWGSILLAIASFVWLMVAIEPHPYRPPPTPAPWSCASELAQASVVDAGGQISPVCGASPYPPSGGSGS